MEGSSLCFYSKDMITKLTLFFHASNAGLVLMFSGNTLLLVTSSSPVVNVKPGIRGDIITRISIRDLYNEFCMRV